MFLTALSHFFTPSARRRRDPSSRLSKSGRFVAVSSALAVEQPFRSLHTGACADLVVVSQLRSRLKLNLVKVHGFSRLTEE